MTGKKYHGREHVIFTRNIIYLTNYVTTKEKDVPNII